MHLIKRFIPLVLFVSVLLVGSTFTPTSAIADDEICCADNREKVFGDGGYMCFTTVCNPLNQLCCGTYQP